ncbi:hypothetical protein S7711_04854 [Stachybotrys chartarum IBT 7711]|uniref:SCP domain-containing protein n=1 Tax=Stachybotrys chartarum (strain CBS 109288 / IBT 7711) TaxID=1280523 RepID=A0A084B6C3_STACB|nr:hypothetical protein S7711_04854 [Stachybotrys chartarum IBT 7711]KFA53920.1 hypothetical protein S40293_01796 [Stachybotrys chartarum IBT 40293]
MKASIILATTGAMLAMAGPLGKRVMETDWVVQVVTVTVTEGAPAAAEATGAVFIAQPERHDDRRRTSTRRSRPTTAVVVPAPQPTVVAPPAQATTVAPAPAPVETEPVEQAPAPSSSSSAAPAQNTQPASISGEYEEVMLEQHNIHRRNHSASDLTWDSTLAEYATTIANGCVFAHDMTQGGGGYGQNLASWGSSSDISSRQVQTGAAGVTNQWYNGEVMNWNFYGDANPPSDSSPQLWGHFTQVVWASTERVGCATVSCPAGTVLGLPSWYTVCNYEPAGNFGGQYGTNVLAPRGDATVTV